jgi:hypothetical protein
MNTKEMIEWIDKASYRDLLSKWRFEEGGSPWFCGEIGDYYKKVMFEKRNMLSNADQVNASKSIGW